MMISVFTIVFNYYALSDNYSGFINQDPIDFQVVNDKKNYAFEKNIKMVHFLIITSTILIND